MEPINGCRRGEEITPSASYQAKGPYFYNIILSGGNRPDQKLIIPASFVKKYGKDLSSRGILKVCGDAVWPIEIANSNGKVWLHGDGWKQFKDHYSIEHGHFLMFRYDGNSQFSVYIFDMTATEIEYPSNGQCSDRDDESIEILDDGLSTRKKTRDSEQIVEDPSVDIPKVFRAGHATVVRMPDSTCRGKRTSTDWNRDSHCLKQEIQDEGAPTNGQIQSKVSNWRSGIGSHHSPSVEMMETNPTFVGKNTSTRNGMCNSFQPRDTCSSRLKLQRTETNHDSLCLEQEINEECDEQFQCKEWGSVTESEKTRAFERAAKAIKCSNPFTMVIMAPSDLDYTLNMKLSFVKEHFGDMKNIILRMSGERMWSVKFIAVYQHAKIFSGWKSFVKDNNLTVGDVCVFEVIKGTTGPYLEVAISRAVLEDAKGR